jgi:hypothetical protein
MEAEHYIKTLCQQCDGSIEFPAHAFGEQVNCPHCNQVIQLGVPSDSKKPTPRIPFEQNPKWAKWDIVRNEKLRPIAFTIGISILSVCEINKNSVDYEYHPIACIFGTVLPAFVIGGVWYYRISRKKSVK